ncbi:MAG: hypothetical protein KIT79_03305 [Deltaproteobacteria bacterium]|nr:hypothetical protein [Deltaproteobacteria bacterium]
MNRALCLSVLPAAFLLAAGCAPLMRMIDPTIERSDMLQSAVREFMGGYLHSHADEGRGASLYVHPSIRQKFVEDLRARNIKVTQIDLEKWSWVRDEKGKENTKRASTRIAMDYTARNSIVVKRMYLDLLWDYKAGDWLITDGLFPAADPAGG